jgi:AcrR family transcriptional regulator
MVQIAREAARPRAAARRREILAAAATVFRRRGLHATGMRDIATELDMHVGNLYYYFRNKQELLAFCQEDALGRLIELAQSAAESDLLAAEKLERLLVGHIRCLNEATPGSLAHLEVEALEQPWRRAIQRRRDRYERLVSRLLSEGLERGEFREHDPELVAKALLGSLNWTVKWYRTDGRRSPAEIGREFARLFLGGLVEKARPDSSEASV